MRRRMIDVVLVLAAVGAFAAAGGFQSRILEPRRDSLLGLRKVLPRAMVHAANFNAELAAGDKPWLVLGERRLGLADVPSRVAAIMLAGVRGYLVAYFSIEAEEQKTQRTHEDLLDAYYRITSLAPDYPSLWEFNGWNLAWNVSVQWPTAEQRYEWIRHGIEFLREGLRRNPNSIEIMDRLARIYYWRIEQNTNAADREYFTRRVEEDEGATPLLLAYKWLDRIRRVQAETGEAHPLFNKKTVNSQACFAAHDYAKELAGKALRKMEQAGGLEAEGQQAEARTVQREAYAELQYAAQWWKTAANEWSKQQERFPDDYNAGVFGRGARLGEGIMDRLLKDLTAESLSRDPRSFGILAKSAMGETLITKRFYYTVDPEDYVAP